MRSVLASVLLCSSALAHEPAAVQGQIALEHSPFCEFFVVHTERGFSLLDWRGGHYVFFEGEEVVGPLHTLGVQAIRVAKSEMRAMVEDTAVNLARAQKTFYRRCKLDGAPPEQALSSRDPPLRPGPARHHDLHSDLPGVRAGPASGELDVVPRGRRVLIDPDHAPRSRR